jgi:hypothetical protein
MAFDDTQFNKLIADKKFDEAREVLNTFLREKMNDEDVGAMLTHVAHARLRLANAMNSRYRDVLRAAITNINDSAKKITAEGEKAQLSLVRKQLQASAPANPSVPPPPSTPFTPPAL